MTYLLHQLLEASARRHPERPAVVDGERSLSYRDLDRRANQVANLLVAQGVARGDRVVLYIDKSLEALVGIYGVLKAGATYVPLDPKAPITRLAYITQNCGARWALTGAGKRAGWDRLGVERLVILDAPAEAGAVSGGMTGFGVHELDEQAATSPAVDAIDLDLAYILYTSGSTGEPKGVMLSHLNALTFVRWAVSEFDVRPDDRVSSHAPLHFDLSVFDLFAAAMASAAVVLVPAQTSMFPVQVRKFIFDQRITIWYSVPSILSMLTLRGGLGGNDFPTLRTVLFAGEVFPTKYLRELMHLLPGVRFCNLYGPTETNVCTYYDVPALPESQVEPISIGRAIADVEVLLLSDAGIPVPTGDVGEVCVRGTTVMQGYWADKERTAKALRPLAAGPGPQQLVYHTGDLAQDPGDGNLRFLGRRDAQIKSRGYRIELGEIETALLGHPAVLECAVVAVPDELVTNRIHAHVTAKNGIGVNQLLSYCAERLPRYMVPEISLHTEALPKTSTGKVDRQALRTTVG